MPEYEKLVKHANETALKPIDEKSIRELLEKLTPLLESSNTLYFELINDLRRVPGSDELIKQMKDLNLFQAVEILNDMKKKLNLN
jgi:hypothetical protein